MTLNSLELDSKAKECINYMKETIDSAKISIQEEFSKSWNPRIICFKSTIFQLELFRSVVEKHMDTRRGKKDNKVYRKIENLKREAARLYDMYPEKDTQPSDEEKENLFKKLSEIKEMIT
ncbi:MAG: hypothetical protein WC875_05125 [Candidatus Absconditabacterales bacterium]